MLDINDPKFRELIGNGIPIERLEKRLRPKLGLDDWEEEAKEHDEFGDYSREGFLGNNERLLEVVKADWETVERYGTTHQEIAEALAKAIKRRKVPNRQYTFEHKVASGGLQGCPWGCKEEYKRGNGIILIYNTEKTSQTDIMALMYTLMLGEEKGRRMEEEIGDRNPAIVSLLKSVSKNQGDMSDRIAALSEIHPHLIGEHYFFEGRQSPYRADPQVLIPALNLARHPLQE